MKTIKITNGEIIIKDFCTRKLKKQINKTMFGNVSASTDGKLEGVNMEAMDNANDVALLGMIEKIVINNEEKEIKIETLDEMNTKDVDLILEEVNKITTKTVPNN